MGTLSLPLNLSLPTPLSCTQQFCDTAFVFHLKSSVLPPFQSLRHIAVCVNGLDRWANVDCICI